MVDSKYTECVDIEFGNFPDCLHNNNLLTLVGNFGPGYSCYLAAERKLNDTNGKEYFSFGILFVKILWTADKIEVRYKCFIKNNIEPDVQCEEVKERISPHCERNNNYKYTENNYDMEEILDESNGFLENGRMTIRVEISVDTFISPDGIRQWGFPRFDADQKQWIAMSLIFSHGSINISANREIIEFHAPSLPKKITNCCENGIDQFLQIMHGVQLFYAWDIFSALSSTLFYANYYKIFNVLRICEQHITNETRLGYDPSGYCEYTFRYNMRCFLKVLLEKVESPKKLKQLLEKEKWEESSAEIMKHLVAKFFSFV